MFKSMAGRYQRLVSLDVDHSKGSENGEEVYVVEVPKDQIVKHSGSRARGKVDHIRPLKSRKWYIFLMFLRWLLLMLCSIIAVVAIAVFVIFLVYSPKFPQYYVADIKVRDFVVREDFRSLFSEMDVIIRADNRNKKAGIYYQNNCSVAASYNQTVLGEGRVEEFYQGHENVTVMVVKLTGMGIEWSKELHQSLAYDRANNSVPLNVKMSFPVKMKVGNVMTRRETFKVDCKLIVRRLISNDNSEVQTETCSLHA